jgi:hypothetical protein
MIWSHNVCGGDTGRPATASQPATRTLHGTGARRHKPTHSHTTTISIFECRVTYVRCCSAGDQGSRGKP